MAAVISSPTTTTTTARPRRSCAAVHFTQHSRVERPQRTERAHDHGRDPMQTKRSCITEVFLGENGGHRGVSTQPPAEQDHRRRHVVLQDVRQTRGSVFSAYSIETHRHGGRQAHLALTLRHIRSPHTITYSRNRNFELIAFSKASCSTSNSEKATSTSGSMHFLSGGSSSSEPASSAATRELCS